MSERIMVNLKFYATGDALQDSVKEAMQIKDYINANYDNNCTIDKMFKAPFGSLEVGCEITKEELKGLNVDEVV